MQEQLKASDILALGFMTFAFFLGAGNIIFPPQAGFLAGEFTFSAMMGFLVTAVGLPLAGVIAIAVAGGGWKALTRDLPSWAATAIALSMFVIIGPAFAAPRAGLVAYEMGFKPFLTEPSQMALTLFSIAFFVIAMLFALSQGKLIDTIGKILTPVLLLGLVVLACAVALNPFSEVGAAQGAYINQPFVTGFLEGYNTMDTFGALMFGMLIVDVIRKKGISSEAKTCKYLIIAGLMAAAGLAFIYISLFYLGATSVGLTEAGSNGGQILVAYVANLFGPAGQIILSIIIGLACLTTVIGLLSTCADYFSSLCKITYNQWVVILALVCGVVANVGLEQLISISIPVLFMLYPVAISLVVLTFLRPFMADQRLAYRLVIGVAFVFALLDAMKVAGLDMSVLNGLPLFNYGLAWLPAMLLAIVAAKVIGRRTSGVAKKASKSLA